MFDRLGSIQFDPIEIAGRNHDLVLLSRVAGYRRELTDRLLYEERSLYETYNKGLSLVPTAELPWYRIAWDRARLMHDGGAFDEHAPLVEELLDRIRTTGPSHVTEPTACSGGAARLSCGWGRRREYGRSTGWRATCR
nr:winged helix DNA-binding domain-containing protein [Actinomycetota bacterium]